MYLPWEAEPALMRTLRASRLFFVLALSKLLDELGPEGGQVVGGAAGYHTLVGEDLFAYPLPARVADVGLQRLPIGRLALRAAELAALDEPGEVFEILAHLALGV